MLLGRAIPRAIPLPYIVCMPKSTASKKARVLSSREAYRGPVFWVTTDDVLEPTGVRVRRDVVRHSGSVVVLALEDSTDDPRVLLESKNVNPQDHSFKDSPPAGMTKAKTELRA